jgi:hypothetical protein
MPFVMPLKLPELIGRCSETCGNASVIARNDLRQIKRLMRLVLATNTLIIKNDDMTTNDLDRLNAQADKALNDNVSANELKEFNQLLTQWNESTEN